MLFKEYLIMYNKKAAFFKAAFFVCSVKLVGIVIEVSLDKDNGCTLVTGT